MKKLVMLIALGFVVPMFAARPILKYGDRNPITGKVVGPYKGQANNQEFAGYNKGITGGYNNNNVPETRPFLLGQEEKFQEEKTSFVDENGKPLPPALPPKSPTSVGKPGRQLTREELKAQKNKILKKQKTIAHEKPAMTQRPALPFTGADLGARKASLKGSINNVRPALPQENNMQTSLKSEMAKRRSVIEPENESVTEEWD